MTMIKRATHSALGEAIDLGPAPSGNLATIPVFSHGTMEAELYTPQGTDPQTPHTRDEIYVVAKGSEQFFDGQEIIEVKKGSFIFVPAGTEHRFLNRAGKKEVEGFPARGIYKDIFVWLVRRFCQKLLTGLLNNI